MKKRALVLVLSMVIVMTTMFTNGIPVSAANSKVTVDMYAIGNSGSPEVFGMVKTPNLAHNDNVLPKLASVGIKAVRFDGYPEYLIPESLCPSLTYWQNNTNNIQNPDNWNWEHFDGLVKAKNQGMKVMLSMCYTPEWLSYKTSGTNRFTGIPKNWAVWQDILKKIYLRYQNYIDQVEFLNEPIYFMDLAGSPYTDKVAASIDIYYYGASAIRSVSSTVPIGGISAFDFAEAKQIIGPVLEDSRITPASNLFNFASYHVYGDSDMASSAHALRDIFASKGHNRDLPIYFGEWNDNPYSGDRETFYTYKGIPYVGLAMISAVRKGVNADYFGCMPRNYPSDAGHQEGSLNSVSMYTWSDDTDTGTLLPQLDAFKVASVKLGLGDGNYSTRITTASGVSGAIGVVNSSGNPVVYIANNTSSSNITDVKLNNVAFSGNVTVTAWTASQSNPGDNGVTLSKTVNANSLTCTVTLPAYSVVGIKVTGAYSCVSGGSIYKIKSRWNDNYVHIEHKNGKVEYSTISDPNQWSAHWIMEETDNGYKRMKNRWTGDYLHVEHNYSYVEYGALGQPDWWSAQWDFEPTSDGIYKIRNRWQPQKYMHIENNYGYVQNEMLGNYDWWSAQWILEPVD